MNKLYSFYHHHHDHSHPQTTKSSRIRSNVRARWTNAAHKKATYVYVHIYVLLYNKSHNRGKPGTSFGKALMLPLRERNFCHFGVLSKTQDDICTTGNQACWSELPTQKSVRILIWHAKMFLVFLPAKTQLMQNGNIARGTMDPGYWV